MFASFIWKRESVQVLNPEEFAEIWPAHKSSEQGRGFSVSNKDVNFGKQQGNQRISK